MSRKHLEKKLIYVFYFFFFLILLYIKYFLFKLQNEIENFVEYYWLKRKDKFLACRFTGNFFFLCVCMGAFKRDLS